jgi:hypothetical protein
MGILVARQGGMIDAFRRSSGVVLLALAACGEGSTGVSSTGGSSSSSMASTSMASGATSAASTMATTSTTTSSASGRASGDGGIWQAYLCQGIPCYERQTPADGAAYPPLPPWPDAGVLDGDGGLCPALGAACDGVGTKCGDPANLMCGPVEECLPADRAGPGYGGQYACPVSSRTRKQDIHYVDDSERESLANEALHIRLATYRYRPEAGDPAPTHLGFVIEDDPASPAVTPDRQHVDLYGYVSMAVATMQQQAREIEALRARVEELSQGICPAPRTSVAGSRDRASQ